MVIKFEKSSNEQKEPTLKELIMELEDVLLRLKRYYLKEKGTN